MMFSGKTFAITALICLAVGFLIGYIPQHSKTVAATQQADQAQAQQARTAEEAQLNGFKNRLGVIYVEAEKKNFAQASSDASALFTAMQSYTERTPDSGLRQQLSALLTSRDAIIAGLAKGDEPVTGQLQELFLKLQSVAPSASPAQ